MSPAALIKAMPSELFEEPGPVQAWRKSALSSVSDAELIRTAAAIVSVPKAADGNSFTLHAPLELLARAALLSLVPEHARDRARWRIAGIAARYADSGPGVDQPPQVFRDATQAEAALLTALQNRDVQSADAAYMALCQVRSLRSIRTLLAPRMLPGLAAAAHAPILFAHLPEWDERIGALSGLARGAIRAIAADPALKLTWMFSPSAEDRTDSRDLMSALISPPRLHSPNHFIAPMLLAAEAHGAAARLAGPLRRETPGQAARVLMRTAALSMLFDEPAQAPYGWSHALTIPLGILGHVQDVPTDYPLLEIAATHTLAFRGVMGRTNVPHDWTPDALPATEPHAAAAAKAAYVCERPFEMLVPQLAARAAAHEDGHLVKYTQACLIAAAQDPQAQPLYLAAAAYLSAWWEAHPDAGFEP